MASHKNHQQREYKHLREVVLWLHDYTCFVSGVKSKKLEVHHIDKNSLNHDIKNLIPVTPEIHKYLGRVTKLNQLESSYIVELLEARKKSFS